jgi:predicted DNA-binding transcriptional regulator YafY
MARDDRLYALLQILRDGRLHRAADLGARLGVSTRTVWRDMALLAATGLPIEGERGVGYILRGPITLPPLILTPAEIEALHKGLTHVAQDGDTALGRAART